MNAKKMFVGLIILILVMPFAMAAPNKLLIDKVKATISGRTSTVTSDGDTFGREAKPGDSVSFKVTFRNNYTDAEDLRIEDVIATVTIEGIDDGDDIDEESNSFDVRANDDKDVTVSFEIPVEVEEDTYTVRIEAEGEDENGTDQIVEWTVKMDLEKKSDELRYDKETVSPSDIKCSGTATLTLGIINTGSDDQEDIDVKVTSTALNYEKSVLIPELTADPFEDDSKTTKTFSITVPKGTKQGTYPITYVTTYDSGRKTIDGSLELAVEECPTETPTETETQNEKPTSPPKEEEPEEVVVITQPTTPIVPAQTTTETVEETSFFESPWFIGIFIAAMVIIIIIVLSTAVMLIKGSGRE